LRRWKAWSNVHPEAEAVVGVEVEVVRGVGEGGCEG